MFGHIESPGGATVEELKPSDIVHEVRAVLADAHRGKGERRPYLTAFQISQRNRVARKGQAGKYV